VWRLLVQRRDLLNKCGAAATNDEGMEIDEDVSAAGVLLKKLEHVLRDLDISRAPYAVIPQLNMSWVVLGFIFALCL
jgi:hypothetical protein